MALTDYELTPCARRIMNLFFLIDVSGSMDGEKIAAVNDAMRNIIPIIREISGNNPDADIKVSSLAFSNGCHWLNLEPVAASCMQWHDVTADGMTELGGACMELNSKLSHKHGFLKSASGSYAPVVILLSDGGPTDDFDGGLNDLKQNAWFRHATRIAIAIGNDADVDVLKRFTGSIELVFRVHDIEALKTVIKVAVITSSMVSSSSSSVGSVPSASGGTVAPTKAQLTAQAIAQQLDGTEGIDVAEEAAAASINPDEFD